MDIFHKFFLVARKHNNSIAGLHQRPLPPNARVLDLGCGTGIWAIDMAEYATPFPRSDHHLLTASQSISRCYYQRLGFVQALATTIVCYRTDHEFHVLHTLNRPSIPTNLNFAQYDIEDPWPDTEGPWDLIHVRMLAGSIRNWSSLYGDIFR